MALFHEFACRYATCVDMLRAIVCGNMRRGTPAFHLSELSEVDPKPRMAVCSQTERSLPQTTKREIRTLSGDVA